MVKRGNGDEAVRAGAGLRLPRLGGGAPTGGDARWAAVRAVLGRLLDAIEEAEESGDPGRLAAADAAYGSMLDAVRRDEDAVVVCRLEDWLLAVMSDPGYIEEIQRAAAEAGGRVVVGVGDRRFGSVAEWRAHVAGCADCRLDVAEGVLCWCCGRVLP